MWVGGPHEYSTQKTVTRTGVGRGFCQVLRNWSRRVVRGCGVGSCRRNPNPIPVLAGASLWRGGRLSNRPALSLAYYHRRWSLAVFGATLTLIVPCSVNLLWARYLRVSLIYPLVSMALIGVVILTVAHYRIAGPQPVDFAEEAMVRRIMEHVKPLPLFDRLLFLFILVCVVALILVHLIR